MSKKYEINGVVTYAHCYSMEVEASSKKEATKIAESRIHAEVIDNQIAEFQEYIMDEPMLLDKDKDV